jgi:omega-3 fatty acid desaturase (delta-15 desaturase)
LFVPNERKDVITSTVCWTAMAALLVGLGFVMGPIQLIKLYGIPYVVNSIPLLFSNHQFVTLFFLLNQNEILI